jgi:hypothetical protein
LRHALHDVDEYDVRVVTFGEPLCSRRAYVTCTDYSNLPSHLVTFPKEWKLADFLSQTRTDIDKRLKELRPLHEEYLTLLKAKEALEGVGATRRGPGRPRSSADRAPTRRRRRGGTRADQALKAVKDNPGITVGELAPRLKIKHKNYLYRVLNGLQDDGLVRKQGRGYLAT